jgi:hypothetical protein
MASGQDNSHTRRYLLQTGATALGTGLAGCIGGDGSDSTPEQDSTGGEESSQETQEESEPEDYDMPESEHMDTQTLVENWGTTYSSHNRVLIDSFSPSQIDEQYDTTWIEGNGQEGRYDVFSFSHENIPETLIQETPDTANHNVIKVDQIPNGASDEELKSTLEENGYTEESEIAGFTIYTTPDEREARAIGQGKHILAFGKTSAADTSTNTHMDYLTNTIEDYSEDNQVENVQDLTQVLDLQDSLTFVENDAEFVQSLQSSTQPLAGAVTVNFDEEIKYGAWKFEDEETAETAYEIMSGRHGDLSNEFTRVDLDGKYITAEGGYDLGDNFSAAYFSDFPII